MNNPSIQSIKAGIQSFINVLIRYRVVLFVTIVTVAIGFMLIRISAMATTEPTQNQKQEASASIKVVKINESTVEVIKQLQSRDIKIEALFEPGRYDPFAN